MKILRWLILLVASASIVQAECRPLNDRICIQPQSARLYPSLVAVSEIHVTLNDPALSELSLASADYQAIVNKKPVLNLFAGLRPAMKPGTHEPDLTVVYLILRRGVVEDGDLLQIRYHTVLSNEEKIQQPPNFTLTLNPSFVQSEALKNGQKRPVGQLGISFDEQTLTPDNHRFRTYLKTNSVISTDAKDKNSNVNLSLGLERSLTRYWYIPFHLEMKMIGDQVADNISSVSSAGLRTIVPWAWTRSFLSTPFFAAPVSPEFTFDGQFQRIFRQDGFAAQKFTDKNAFRLFGQGSWTPIQILKGDGKGDYLSLELVGKGWYIPHQHTPQGIVKDRLEGLLNVSVLVPVGKLNATSGGLDTASKGTKTQIRILYSRGANEANGFKHASQLSIGIEAVGSK